MFESESLSYYEILDIQPDASPSDIRQAYIRTKAAYAKDSAAIYSLFDDQETRQVLDQIEQAYLVLSNPEKRKEYDKVHGFFGSNASAVFSQKPANKSFSFSDSSSESASAIAQSAARNVFGAPESESVSKEDKHLFRDSTRTDSYSTPRTLAEAERPNSSFSNRPQDLPTSTESAASFDLRESKLGLVRRNELATQFTPSDDMESAIKNETEFRGDFLKKVRTYKNVSIDELCEFTKISKTYLNCIESEEFESLPAPAYVRGFVVQIAKALKIPSDKVANGYMTNYKNTVLK